MDVARCFAEAQERMNIPDETDEEFLARMAAARRRQYVLSTYLNKVLSC